MSTNEGFPQTGIVMAAGHDLADNMTELTHAILDDIFHNIIHDICLKTHRDEKIARASSAALLVEQQAKASDPNPPDATDLLPHKFENDAATYDNGSVYLKGNPLETTKGIVCPKCGLPRLLFPTDGAGARKPEPGVEYCTKRPYIEKPYHDIYGQTFVPEGPGRGKKKKDMINPLIQLAKESTPSGSQDSPNGSPQPPEIPKPIPFPHAKCHSCGTFLPIKRMNNHMVKCIGGGGRDSSRNALWKIQNGNGNGSQNGTTPPGSRAGTPGSGANNGKVRSSPTKRSPDEDFDSDSPQKKKKVFKKSMVTKLKAPKMAKSLSQPSSSNLSFEVSNADEEYEENDDEKDDEKDGEYGKKTVTVDPKKKIKLPKKPSTQVSASKKKWLHGKGGPKASLPPIVPPDVQKAKTGDADSETSPASSPYGDRSAD